MSYIYHGNFKTCNDCGANLDPDEQCDCQEKKIGIDFAGGPDMTSKSTSSIAFDKWVREFAKNNGMSIDEAYEHPTVRMHLRLACLED